MTYCKIGFLAGVGGNRNGIGDYIRRLNAAKRPAVVMAYDDAGLIAEAAASGAQHGVDNVLAFRPATIYGAENPDYLLPPLQAANAYYDRWVAGISADIDRAQVWCIAFNEGRKEAESGDWWGWTGLHFAQRANADGYRVALYGWSAGTPEPEGYEAPGWAALLRYIDANHDRVGIAVHEGADPAQFAAPAGAIPLINNVPYITARYRQLFARCDHLGTKRPYILITECAWRYDSAPAVAVGMPQVIEAAEFYAADPEVLGVGLWWLGSGHQGVADTLQPYIAPLTDYALSYEAPEQPMPEFEHPTSVPLWAGEWNPYKYALSQRIYADGWRPSSEEWQEEDWLYQAAMNADGDERIYGVPIGQWDSVRIVHPAEPAPLPIVGQWGIDVSHAQAAIDWRQLKAAGCAFAIIRGGYGTVADTMVDRHYSAARAAGVRVMPYWFVDRRFDPATTGRAFAEYVTGREWDGPAWFDVEVISVNGVSVTPNAAQVRACIAAYLAVTNYPAGVYTGQHAWNSIMGNVRPSSMGITDMLWLAEWEPPDGAAQPDDLPRAFTMADLRIVQEPARILPGYDRQLDYNVILGSLDDPNPTADTVDLWEYMTGGVTDGWGAPYMVEVLDHNGQRAGMERYQAHVKGNRLTITKNDLCEIYELRNGIIWQVIDTSPGNMDAGEPTYYRVTGGGGYAPRHMAVGQTWHEPLPHTVTFYRMRDCVDYGSQYSGMARNVTTVLRQLADVVIVGGGEEEHLFKRGMGRIGWRAEWGSARLSTDDPGDYNNAIVLPGCAGV